MSSAWPELEAARVAVVGDLHGRWNALDNRFFDRAGFDLLLFVGDLGSGSKNDGLSVIRQISRLSSRGLVLPGNNDADHLAYLSAELAYQAGRADLLRAMHRDAARGVEPCGYSGHRLRTPGGTVSLVAARPCATGGSGFAFGDMLARLYDVHSLADSAARLCALVDASPDESLLFLAHNGPFGLGGAASDPWHRDFPVEDEDGTPRDWGDADLTTAIAHARALGKRVLGVIGGHMHRRPGRGTRPFSIERDGVLYVNAACVPRIVLGEDVERHHYVEIELDPTFFRASEHWIDLSESPVSSRG